MTKLQSARQALGAVGIGAGQYAHYDDATQRYWTVSADDLRRYMDFRRAPETSADAYSHWCAATCAREMPEGWGPGR